MTAVTDARGSTPRPEGGGCAPLAGKLAPPRLHVAVLPRSRVQEKIDHAAEHRATLISAPAGSGKTTACASWSMTCGRAHDVAWLTVDPADNQPHRFWSHLVAALGQVQPSLRTPSPDRAPPWASSTRSSRRSPEGQIDRPRDGRHPRARSARDPARPRPPAPARPATAPSRDRSAATGPPSSSPGCASPAISRRSEPKISRGPSPRRPNISVRRACPSARTRWRSWWHAPAAGAPACAWPACG